MTDTMRKWTIELTDGHKFTMLSQQCQTQEEALEAAREKWGERVALVTGNVRVGDEKRG